MAPVYEDNSYFWLCDECKTIHMWSNKPKYCYRQFVIKKKLSDISIDKIKKLNEYIVVNINEFDEVFISTPIKDLMIRNTINQYKYFATEDLMNLYVYNIDTNKIEAEYELTYESSLEEEVKIDSFDDILIYTIDKKNNGTQYIIENGVRKEQDDIYPYFQVNFMITKKDEKGSIGYADPNRKPEIYYGDSIDEFYNKYGYLYESRKKKYYYVEYLDMVGDRLYCYKSLDDYEEGDIVLVPRGYYDKEVEARIISIKKYTEDEAPYPYEDLKYIIDYSKSNE